MKPTFITRNPENRPIPDYISEVNDILRDGGILDPNSPIYQSALEQYNAQLARGVTERLEVPVGFCGYIDPATGLFRVEPDIVPPDLRMPILFPDEEVDPSDVQPLSAIPYPIDLCLQHGLPGSYEYTVENCGIETGDNDCGPVEWFSGAGTDSDFGTAALSQNVCGEGDGINSNKSLATSSPIGGVRPEYPPHVKDYAHSIALSMYPPNIILTWNVTEQAWTPTEEPYTGAGWVEPLTNVRNLLGTIITHSFFYNIHDESGIWRQAGLRVSVSWNTETEEIVGHDTELMYDWGGLREAWY